MFTENIRKAIKKSGFIVKDISAQSGVKKATLDDWLNARTKMARADDLYKVCKVIGITVEEAVAGDEGRVYVRNWVTSEGRGYIPPPRIADIVEELNRLDDKSLLIVRGTLSGISEGGKDRMAVAAGTPRDISPEGGFVAEIEAEYKANSIINFPNDVEYLNWEMIMIPYFGKTAAGNPLDIYTEPDDYLPIARQQLRGPPEDYFYLQIRGYSLVNAGINEGDLVVIRRAKEAENGKIMLVRYENSTTLKRVVKRGGKTYLCWEDGTDKQIQVDSEDYEVQGVLTWITKAPGK